MSQRFRNCLITDFNTVKYDDWTLDPSTKIKFMTFQLEKAPSTQRLHFQVYVEFKTQVRMNFIKDIFGDEVHIENRKGSQAEAIAYCNKEETRVEGPWTYGKKSEQGKRSDLEQVAEDILAGDKLRDIALNNPVQYIKFSKGIKELKAQYDESKIPDFRKVEVEVLAGETGLGKTRQAVEKNKDYYKLDKADKVWFDGYDGQKTLIIDDFYGWIPFGQLLNILDGYKLRLEIKGSFTWAQWDKVILTSNKTSDQWYTNITTAQAKALERRINSEVWMIKPSF